VTEEETAERLKEYIRVEEKSGSLERKMVAAVLYEIFEENGQPELMVSSMEELIHAAEAAIKKVKELTPAEPVEGEKRFMVAYSVRFFNGAAIVKDTDSVNAKAQIEEDWATEDLTDDCQDTAVDVEAIWELDENNNEVPNTREEFP
jgi:hypothetical protein